MCRSTFGAGETQQYAAHVSRLTAKVAPPMGLEAAGMHRCTGGIHRRNIDCRALLDLLWILIDIELSTASVQKQDTFV